MKKKLGLRTKKTQKIYDEYRKNLPKGCVLCRTKPVKDFVYWRLIPNHFPYDKIAQKHQILFPKKHKALLSDLSKNELQELYEIQEKTKDFDVSILNFPHQQTIPDHFHIHLIEYKTIK